MTSDLIQRLFKQLLICFALMTCLTLMMLFSSKVHVGWLVYPALLIGGTFFTTLGVVIGDGLRRFTKPDIIFAGDGVGLFKQKVFWLIGPQVIGWIIGMIATQGFLSHVPGYVDSDAEAQAAMEARVREVIAKDVPTAPATVDATAQQATDALPPAGPAMIETPPAEPVIPAEPSLVPAVQACVDAKTKAASKTAADGSEKLITHDMLQEWAGECQAAVH